DRWRDRDAAAMDEAWKYDHYIDLEVVPAAALQAPDRFSYLLELHRLTKLERPARDAGMLPYRIIELYQRLVTGMRQWRAATDEAERGWIEQRIINDAGILGHYVTDGSQPHHTSVHHNGWNESYPNPRGYTTDRTFHSRFESRFVEANVTADDLIPRIAAEPRRIENVRDDVLSYLRATHSQLDRLYQLEQAEPFSANTTAGAHREFAVQRLVAGAEMLRAMWWCARLESGSSPAPLPPPVVCQQLRLAGRVEAGLEDLPLLRLFMPPGERIGGGLGKGTEGQAGLDLRREIEPRKAEVAAARRHPHGQIAVRADVALEEPVRVDPGEGRFRGGHRADPVEQLVERTRNEGTHGVEGAGRVVLREPDHPFAQVARIDDLHRVGAIARG